MKKTGTRSWVRGLCVVAVLAVIAIPLWNLMVAQSPVEIVADDVVTATLPVNELSTEASETSSAVSALMAGSAVGPSRGAIIDLRHPATAFVP